MEYKIVRSGMQAKKKWSNGSSTQLFIYPDNSTYENKDFSIRLSVATVESEVSTFANLPQHERSIVLLEGDVALENTNTVQLKLFEPYNFSGALNTISHGQGKDFNFMVKNGTKYNVKVIDLQENPIIINLHSDKDFLRHNYFFYLLNGHMEVHNEQEHIALKKEDLLSIKLQSIDQINVGLAGHGKVIFCEAFYN